MNSYKQRIEAINNNVVKAKTNIDDALQEIGFTESTPNETFQQYADWIRNHLTRDTTAWDLDLIVKDSFSSLGLDLTAPEIAFYRETQLKDGSWKIQISLEKTLNQWDEEESAELKTTFWDSVQQNLPGVISVNTISPYASLPTFTTINYPLSDNEYLLNDCSTGTFKEGYKGTININGEENGESNVKVTLTDSFFDYINLSDFSGHLFLPRWQGFTNNGYAEEFKATNVTGTLELHNLSWDGEFIANNFATFTIDNTNLESSTKELSLLINGKNEFDFAPSYYTNVTINHTHLNLDLTSFQWRTFKLNNCTLYNMSLGTFSGLIENSTYNEIITFENCDFQNRNDINTFLTALLDYHYPEAANPLYIRFKKCENYAIDEKIIERGENQYVYIIEEGFANVTIEYYKDFIHEENLAMTITKRRVEVGESLIGIIENNIVSPELVYGYKYSGEYELSQETVTPEGPNTIKLIVIPMENEWKCLVMKGEDYYCTLISPEEGVYSSENGYKTWIGGNEGDILRAYAVETYPTILQSMPPQFAHSVTQEEWNLAINGTNPYTKKLNLNFLRSFPSAWVDTILHSGDGSLSYYHLIVHAMPQIPSNIEFTAQSDGINTITLDGEATTTSITKQTYLYQQITLEASPADGYEFSYWDTEWEELTDNPLTYFATETPITAVFTPIEPVEKVDMIISVPEKYKSFLQEGIITNETTGETLFEGDINIGEEISIKARKTDTIKIYGITPYIKTKPYVRYNYSEEPHTNYFEEYFKITETVKDENGYSTFKIWAETTFTVEETKSVEIRQLAYVNYEYYKDSYDSENLFRKELNSDDVYEGDVTEVYLYEIDKNALEGYELTDYRETNQSVEIGKPNTLQVLFTPIKSKSTPIRFYDGEAPNSIIKVPVTIINNTNGESHTVNWADMDFTMMCNPTDIITLDLTSANYTGNYIKIHRKDLDNYELIEVYSNIITLTAENIEAIEFRQYLDLHIEFYKDSFSYENLVKTEIVKNVVIAGHEEYLDALKQVNLDSIFGYIYSGTHEQEPQQANFTDKIYLKLLFTPLTIGGRILVKCDGVNTIQVFTPEGETINIVDEMYIYTTTNNNTEIYFIGIDIYNNDQFPPPVSNPPTSLEVTTKEKWEELIKSGAIIPIETNSSDITPKSLPSDWTNLTLQDGIHYYVYPQFKYP